MKKENFGIPTALLNVMIYALALYITVNSVATIWALLGFTVVAFALNFSGSVKKTLVQASALVLIFIGVHVVFSLFGCFFSFAATPSVITGESLYSKYNDLVDVINTIISIAAYGIFALLAIMALVKKDLFVGPVYKAVDGFVPRPQYQQQPVYNGQPQQFYGQPQQFNGQPQQPK